MDAKHYYTVTPKARQYHINRPVAEFLNLKDAREYADARPGSKIVAVNVVNGCHEHTKIMTRAELRKHRNRGPRNG